MEQLRKEFIAQFTHEIKTPLSIINGNIDLLENVDDEDKKAKYIEVINKEIAVINDLYQDVVLSLWKSFRNFKGHSSVSTWIYRITLNTCITNLRKKKNYDYVPLKQDIDILDDCEHDECMKHLYQLIHQLDNVDKMYIMLWLDEKSYDEIAEIVGVGRNNVAIRIHRIKEKLKKMSNR